MLRCSDALHIKKAEAMKGGEAHIVAGVIDTGGSRGINPHIILEEAALNEILTVSQPKSKAAPEPW